MSILAKSNRDISFFIDEFNNIPNSIIILNGNTLGDKTIESLTLEELKELFNSFKELDIVNITNKWGKEVFDEIKFIPYTKTKSGEGFEIKIQDKEGLLNNTTEFMILKYKEDGFMFNFNSVIENIEVNKTNAGYFNLRLNENTTFVPVNTDKIIIFYKIDSFSKKGEN